MSKEKDQPMYIEGYWAQSPKDTYDRLAFPVEGSFWFQKTAFLNQLSRVEQEKAKNLYYKGFSICRICKMHNGASEHQYRNWRWPEGLRHYVYEHDVRPSLAFQIFIAHCVGEEIEL